MAGPVAASVHQGCPPRSVLDVWVGLVLQKVLDQLGLADALRVGMSGHAGQHEGRLPAFIALVDVGPALQEQSSQPQAPQPRGLKE